MTADDTVSEVKKQGEVSTREAPSLFAGLQPRISATYDWGLPCSPKAFWKHGHRRTQRCVYMTIDSKSTVRTRHSIPHTPFGESISIMPNHLWYTIGAWRTVGM